MRTTATHWIEVAERVWHYRRDVLDEDEGRELRRQTTELRQAVRERADAAQLKLMIERLEGTLQTTGGRLYPKTSLVENVEFFLMAAIVILGLRTYFVQPFKIPTNSMWPSYYGMTSEVYQDPTTAPGPLGEAARFLLFGAVRQEIIAPESGPISVPVLLDGEIPPAQKVAGRRWFVLPAVKEEYVIYVNRTPVTFQLPEDFDFDTAFGQAFGVTRAELAAQAEASTNGTDSVRWVTLPVEARVGEPIMTFDIMTGDQLFVDRVSYHFVRPKVGQGFVFRTGNIPPLAETWGDQYYIKRLVGTPGDVLEIREPVLLRNGAPIDGAGAFDRNNRQEGLYRGYFNGVGPNAPLLRAGQPMAVPEDAYFALGDNSGNSLDGRYWGTVPKKDVVGRPLFIYYPFTSRWLQAR